MDEIYEEQLYKKIGEILRQFRLKTGLKQVTIAERVGIYPSDLTAFEKHGKGIRSFYRIKQLVEATGHTMSDLEAVLNQDQAHLQLKKKSENPLQLLKRKMQEFSNLTDRVLEAMEADAQKDKLRARTANEQEEDCQDCQAEFNEA